MLIINKKRAFFILSSFLVFLYPFFKKDNYFDRITSFSQIHLVHHFKQGKTVLFVDIDDVVIMAKDLVLRSCDKQNPFKIIDTLRKAIVSQNEEERLKALELLGILRISRKVQLVEKDIPIFLAKFRAQEVDIIGITHINTGQCSPIVSIEDWRVNELKSLGVDFSRFSKINLDLRKLNSPLSSPNFVKGIIFTDNTAKGKCIEMFLNENPQYKNIYVIDDNLKNITDIYEHIRKYPLYFKAFHYIAAKKAPGRVNPKIGKVQQESLFLRKIWLSDEEASQFLSVNSAN